MAKTQQIVGVHAVRSVLEHSSERIQYLMVQSGRDDKNIQAILDTAKQMGISVQNINKQKLEKIAGSSNHQGIAAVCREPDVLTDGDLIVFLDKLSEPAFFLVLDGVQDPHNLGACLRTADAAGVHGIIIPKDKSVGITTTVQKVSSGAAETVPVFQVANLARTLKLMQEQGIWLFGADAEAQQTIYTADLKGPIALVMGAEGSGLRRLTRESCDVLINIPMQGSVESLNVSVASAVTIYEAYRQRLK